MGFLSDAVKSVTGSLGGGLFGLAGGAMTNSASASAAQAANAFTKEQLQNRHQWEVKDLRKAGLNPILSTHAAPSIGSSAKAEVANMADAATKGASVGLQASLAREQLKNIAQDTELKQAQAAAAASSAKSMDASAAATMATIPGLEGVSSAKAMLTQPSKAITGMYGKATDIIGQTVYKGWETYQKAKQKVNSWKRWKD